MLKQLLDILTVQEYDQQRVQSLLTALLQGAAVVASVILIALIGTVVTGKEMAPWMLSSPVLLVLLFGLQRFNRRGYISLTANLFLFVILLWVALAEPLGFSKTRMAPLIYALPIVMATLLISPKASLVWSGIIALVIVTQAVIMNLIVGAPVDLNVFLLSIIGLGVVTLIVQHLGRSAWQTMHSLRKRIQQGQASIEIGHTVTAELDASSAMRQAVQLIYDAFDYYQVGLFMVDPEHETAVLMDVAGERASDLKGRKFHVPLNGLTAVASAINYNRRCEVCSWKETVDPMGRTVQFTYERLPSRVELVIPLQVRGRVLGALDIHSTELKSFPEEDVHTLVGLVGHVANALQTSNLLDDVQQRHQELETLYEQTERRSRYLETAAELARAVSTLLETQELLDKAVELISKGLDLYHVGIFLVDDADEWAVLVSTSSEGGERMLARGHRLRVGEEGIVGWVVHAEQPRIALDVGEDAVFFDNPDLPATRSEIALPLKVGDRVIGALDVQSLHEAAFSDEDAAVLETLADQIAIAIQSVRLLQQTQKALDEMQTLQRYYVSEEWGRLSSRRTDLSAEYRSLGIAPRDGAWAPEMEMALTQKSPVVLPDLNAVAWETEELAGDQLAPAARSALAVPIKLREEVIGVLDLQEMDEERHWTDAEIAMTTAVADQLALALENTRLFEDAQTRAEEMAVLNDLARGLTARQSVEGVVQEAYQGASRLLDTTNFYLALYDSESDVVSFPLAFEKGQQVDWETRRAGSGLTEYVIRNKKALLIPENLPQRMKELGIDVIGTVALSWLGVPLMIGDQILGMMSIQSFTTPHIYDEHSENLLIAIASQTAIAIQSANLFEETRAHAEEVAVLNELAQALTARLNVEQVIEEIYRGASRLLDTTNFYIALYDSEAESISFPLYFDHGERVQAPTRHMKKSGLTEYVIRNRSVVFLPDNLPEHFAEMGIEPLGQASLSWLGAPLIVGERVLGVMAIQSYTVPRLYDEHDRDLLVAIASQSAIALQSSHLFEQTEAALAETEEQARRLALLNEMGEQLSGARTLDEVLDVAAAKTEQVITADRATVALLSAEGDVLELLALRGEDGVLPLGAEVPVEGSLIGQVVRENRLAITQDIRDSDLLDLANLARQEMRSTIVAPLFAGGKALGTLNVASKHPHAYTRRDGNLLLQIASLLSAAFENRRLFDETQRRAAQLAAAAEVAQDATAILDVGQLLNTTVDLISERFEFYHTGVFILDEQGEYAVLNAASSEGGRRMLERGHRLKVGETGIVGYVAGTGEPRVALDVGIDASFFDNPDLPDTRSEMGLPLKAHGGVLGVLDVQSDQPAAFSDEDISVLQTLANQLATAIANARLFEEAKSDALRRALISEVLQAAATSLEPDELLHQAGEVVSMRLETPSAIFTWDSEREIVRPVAFHAADATDIPLPDDFQQAPHDMNHVIWDVARERRVYTLENTADIDEGPLADIVRQAEAGSAIYVPLVARDEVLGVLGLGKLKEHTLVNVEFAELVAANISIALENAHLYQEAVETAERLAEVDRLKTEFLANMSHELRTPLNSIIGFSRVILKEIDGPLTDMQRTDLRAIYESGQHLLGLINDILDLSKIEAGKMELNIEEIDLREMIKGVMSTAVALIKDKPEVNLQQSVPDDVPAIKGDSRRIRQVLLNLVSNSAKFTEEGFIRVEAEAKPSEVTVSVIDTGIGISQEKIEEVFEPFTQADSSTTRRAGGTGLGLSITSSFIEMHGGHMDVESELGKGSTFSFTLPIEGPSQLDEVAEEEPESLETEQKLVLCVEDDEGVILLFRRYLSEQGYRIVGVTDSTDAVERARDLQPFAITLDVMMPEKDGWQVIQDLKSDPETSHIPVIMCTIVSDKEQGISLGASDYLVKPVLEEDLLAALERLDREAGRHLVLVVDDQPKDRKLLRRMIEEQEGYDVVEASGGQDAVALVRGRRPHIIILDLMMPDVDGFAVLESLKANKDTRSIPIIVVTAKELTAEERRILNSGVESLLQKGIFEQDELLEDVAAALERLEPELGDE